MFKFKKNIPRPIVVNYLIILFLTIVFFLVVGIRTISPRINYLVFGMMLIIPLVCFILTQSNGSLKNKIIRFFSIFLTILAIPLFLFWLFKILLLPEILINDNDPSYKLTKTVKIDGNYYRVYVVNGGAMTSFEVDVKKELRLLPGLYFTKIIDSKNRTDDAEIIKEENGNIKVRFNR